VAISNLSGGLHPGLREIFEKGGVPLLQGTREGLCAVHHVVNYAKFLQNDALTQVKSRERRGAIYLERGTGMLVEYEAKKVLSEYSIPCSREVLCHTVQEAIDAFREIGGPVVVKLISPEIPHKTEAGTVQLSIDHETAVRDAYRQVMENAEEYMPNAKIMGVLVQEMITDPVTEVIVGISKDADFGPVVLFGLGGTAVELYRDRTLGIPPLSRDEALEMINQSRASRLLQGFRGKPAGDELALVDVLVQIGQLATHWGHRIHALDINPLLVLPTGQGVVAVDALIEMGTDDT